MLEDGVSSFQPAGIFDFIPAISTSAARATPATTADATSADRHFMAASPGLRGMTTRDSRRPTGRG
jgi:hypothetical protein